MSVDKYPSIFSHQMEGLIILVVIKDYESAFDAVTLTYIPKINDFTS